MSSKNPVIRGIENISLVDDFFARHESKNECVLLCGLALLNGINVRLQFHDKHTVFQPELHFLDQAGCSCGKVSKATDIYTLKERIARAMRVKAEEMERKAKELKASAGKLQSEISGLSESETE